MRRTDLLTGYTDISLMCFGMYGSVCVVIKLFYDTSRSDIILIRDLRFTIPELFVYVAPIFYKSINIYSALVDSR